MFDAYIFIDWSAANGPSPVAKTKDSLWIGELTPAIAHSKETYHRTRQAGTGYVLALLQHHVREKRRVLVGFDFPYGYPHGLAQALGFKDNSNAWCNVWTTLHVRITDNERNASNRFPVASDLNKIISNGGNGPFWCCRKHNVSDYLRTTEPNFPFNAAENIPLQRYRVCERRLRITEDRDIQATWRLFGQGSVGSQALTGIPRLHYLRYHPALDRYSRVWPFETGFNPALFTQKGPFVLHAEIWPGIPEVGVRVEEMLQNDPNMIKDRAQVRAMCQWAQQQDQLGTILNAPTRLDREQGMHCIAEEGWILGVQ